ncbi:MAG: cation diffusion facilitator family transporter [Actinomycetota bacterium]|nr:cation diffusion facilitator family transporter [Actinomycetota bacterium]
MSADHHHDHHEHGADHTRAHEGHHGHPHEHHDHGDHEHPHGHDHRGGIRGAVAEIFRPHSHDAADSIDTALQASERGIRAVKVSFAALMVTAVVQLAIVALTGSVALLADTIHNVSDALTAIPLFLAFKLGRRPPNRRYTYGYRRAEDLAGVFVIAMIALSAVIAGWEAIDRLVHPRPVEHLATLVIAGLAGFAGNELVALYRIREGRAIGSAALVADGHHARTDGFTSLAVALGAIGVWAGFGRADPIVGLVISVAILAVLRGAARQIYHRLMDAVDPAIVERVHDVASAVDGVRAIAEPRVRWLGHRLAADLDVTVDPELDVRDGHAIAEAVRHALLHRVAHLDEVHVHIDPDDHGAHAALAHHDD